MKRLTLARLRHPRKRRRSARRFFYLARVPRLLEGIDVRLLWSYGGYDGTCSGVCEVDGELCYYQNVVSIESRRRIFAVVGLTPSERDEHVRYHSRCRELLGPYRDYEYVDGKRKYVRYEELSSGAYARAHEILRVEFDRASFGAWAFWDAPHQNNRIVGYFEG